MKNIKYLALLFSLTLLISCGQDDVDSVTNPGVYSPTSEINVGFTDTNIDQMVLENDPTADPLTYTIGTKISEPKKIARQIINEGLLKLGIIKSLDEKHSYLPHGTTHHIGLDVHDPGNYKTFEKENANTRKPNTGMFKQAQQDMKYLNFKQGYFVGDKISDLKAAFKIGARPVLVKTGYGEETLKELNKFSNQKIKKKTIIFDTLEEYASWMEKK